MRMSCDGVGVEPGAVTVEAIEDAAVGVLGVGV